MSSPHPDPRQNPGPPGQPQYPGYGAPYGQPYYPGYGCEIRKPTGWFVVNWLFCWPLAIYSLISAWANIDRALFAGDLAGAHYQARRVRTFGIVALCIGLAWIAVVVVLMVAVSPTGVQCVSSPSSNC